MDAFYLPGCVLSQIEKGSVWEKLGFKNGDQILEFNGKSCQSEKDVVAWFKVNDSQKEITIKILRSGNKKILRHKLEP